jgi:hypothetical protein
MQMLKAIVKQKNFTAEVLDCPVAGGDAIRIRNDRGDSHKVLGQQVRLVAGFPGICQEPTSI